jgi:hypothetical protein
MTTNWAKPRQVSQYAEVGGEAVHIPWDFDNISNYGILPLKLAGTLKHIARSPKPNIVNKTYFVRFTGFQITQIPTVVTGIEIRLDVSRHGRITDDCVQLVSGDVNLGSNVATLSIDNVKTYAQNMDLNSAQIQQLAGNLNVDLRFRSHPSWPHNETIIINSVEIRFY